jgi:hypothetical protein
MEMRDRKLIKTRDEAPFFSFFFFSFFFLVLKIPSRQHRDAAFHLARREIRSLGDKSAMDSFRIGR